MPIRMAIIQIKKDKKHWWGCRERGLWTLLVGMQISMVIIVNNIDVSQNIKIEIWYGPVMLFLGIHS